LAAVRHTSADVPFVTEVVAPATTAPKRAFHVGDFDGDGDVDVLVGVGSSAADAAVLLFSNAAVVPLTATLVSASVGLPNSVVMADVDRDSNMDVVCAAADKRVTWLRNQGAGMFGEGSVLTNSTTVVSVGVAVSGIIRV
jgi:cation diffusion facilitator CzcD-associated flavoprotein CzcO